MFTSKHVHCSGGRKVHPSRGCARGNLDVTLAHLPPLPRPAIVTETQLTGLPHEPWTANATLSPL